MLIIAYLSCQEAIYLSQYASVLLTNMVILLMQIKWVHEQTHIHLCVVICVVIGLHLWWKDHDFNACLHAPNSKNEEVLRFWPQSDVLWWMLSPLPTQSTANLHFFLGRVVSTPSDTQTEHSNTKEGDKGPPDQYRNRRVVLTAENSHIHVLLLSPWPFPFAVSSREQHAVRDMETRLPQFLLYMKWSSQQLWLQAAFLLVKSWLSSVLFSGEQELFDPQSRKASAKNIINPSLMSGSQPTFSDSYLRD